MTMTTDQEQLLERISNLESELDAARSQVSLLQADYEEAQEQVDTSKTKDPLSGVFSVRLIACRCCT